MTGNMRSSYLPSFSFLMSTVKLYRKTAAPCQRAIMQRKKSTAVLLTIKSTSACLIQESPLIARVWNVLDIGRDHTAFFTRARRLQLERLVLHLQFTLLAVGEADARVVAFEGRVVDWASYGAWLVDDSILGSLLAFW